jgi:hypothetical protein
VRAHSHVTCDIDSCENPDWFIGMRTANWGKANATLRHRIRSPGQLVPDPSHHTASHSLWCAYHALRLYVSDTREKRMMGNVITRAIYHPLIAVPSVYLNNLMLKEFSFDVNLYDPGTCPRMTSSYRLHGKGYRGA